MPLFKGWKKDNKDNLVALEGCGRSVKKNDPKKKKQAL